jgi:hypothetical protein
MLLFWNLLAAGMVFMDKGLFSLAVKGDEGPATAGPVDARLLRYLRILACQVAEIEKGAPRTGSLHMAETVTRNGLRRPRKNGGPVQGAAPQLSAPAPKHKFLLILSRN